MVDMMDDRDSVRATKSDKPRRDAYFKVAINWWTGISFVLAGVVVFQEFRVDKFQELAAKNIQLEYVKLYPNGTSERGEYVHRDVQDFLPNTIDHLLKHFITIRYGQNPSTIKQDYGEVGLFLADRLYGQFTAQVAQGGFGAVEKAATLTVNPQSKDKIEIHDIWVNNYDTIKGVITDHLDTVVRSNIYYTKVTINSVGVVTLREAKVAPLQWHLIPKDQLEKIVAKNPAFLDINPIGIEIIDGDEQIDPAGAKSGGNK